MAIVVTGAAGFVGNNVVHKLLNNGKTVRALVRKGGMEKARIRLGKFSEQVLIVEGDVRDRERMMEVMRGATAVVHTVAISMEKRGATYEDVNFQGTINVVDAAEKAGVERFIYIGQNGSSSSVPYRFLNSKGKAQDYVASSKLAWTALRPSAIFGPQDEFFNTFARLVRLTPIIFPLIGGGKAEFQPVSVYDVAEAVWRALDDDKTIGQAYDLGGPEVLTLGEIEKRVIEALGTSRLLVPVPVALLRPVVIIMQSVLPGSPVSTGLLDLLAVPNTVPHNGLVEAFGITPIPFSGEHIAYLRNNTAGQALNKFFTNATVN